MDTKPNLIYVFPDALRRHALGFMQQDPVITPVLDAFAQESIVLTNACSAYPVCSPYRASLMTGQYPITTGFYSNCHGISFWHAWALGSKHHTNVRYWTGDSGPEESVLYEDCWSPVHETDVAIDVIRSRSMRNKEPRKPFALFVSWNPPHGPFDDAPNRYANLYKGATGLELLNRPNIDTSQPKTSKALWKVATYFAAISGIDEQFGRILGAVEAEKLEKKTIMVFTSDHGELMASHGVMGKSLPCEESFGVPFMLSLDRVVRTKLR